MMKRLGILLFALASLLTFPSAARAQLTACCSITAVDTTTTVVSAKVNSTGAPLQFKVANAKSLGLRVGQSVYADLKTGQVSLDGKTVCCSVMAAPKSALPPSAATAVAPQNPPPASAASGSTAATAKKVPPASAPPPSAVAAVPPPLTNTPPSTTTSVPPSTSNGNTPATPAVVNHALQAIPTNVHATPSLSECAAHLGGGLAQVACAAAIQDYFVILVWDWSGGDIDGFKVYNVGLWGFAKPIQTIPHQAQQTGAIINPAALATLNDACFAVTAYVGTTENLPTGNGLAAAQFCENVAGPPHPTPPFPPGSYLNACTGLRWGQADSTTAWLGGVPWGALYANGTPMPGTPALFANCRSGGQVSVAYPNVCIWGLRNLSGGLACEIPPGPYQQTCDSASIIVKPWAPPASTFNEVTASCKNKAGAYVNADVGVPRTCTSLANNNGQLQCGKGDPTFSPSAPFGPNKP